MSCRDHEGTEYNREAVYYRQSFTTSGAAEDSAADVVMVVDESGSIYEEVLWIREVLDDAESAITLMCGMWNIIIFP